MYATDTTAFNWNQQKAALGPTTSAAPPGTHLPQLSRRGLAAVGSYGQASSTTEEAERYGVTLRSEADLSRYMVDRAVVSAPGAIGGRPALAAEDKVLKRTLVSLSSGEDVYTAASWHDGSYAFRDVPAGTYDSTIPSDSRNPQGKVVVAGGPPMSTSPAAGGDVSGTILSTPARGSTGARVELKARPDSPGLLLGRGGYDQGQYVFSPVKPGTYDVSVDPPAGYSPPY